MTRRLLPSSAWISTRASTKLCATSVDKDHLSYACRSRTRQPLPFPEAVNTHLPTALRRSGARGLLYLHALDPIPRLAVALRVALADGVHHLHPLDDLPEDGVPVVKPRRRRVGDEELRTAGAWAAVGHRKDARPVVPEVRMELIPDAVAGPAGSRAGGIAALRHEALYDAVEGGPVEVTLPRQEDEVVDGLRRFLGEELDPHDTLLGDEVGVIILVGIERHLRRLVIGLVGHSCLLGTLPEPRTMLPHRGLWTRLRESLARFFVAETIR